jgi:hypothetical protein
MKFKFAIATVVALSMISGTAFAENGCPVGYDRIELVNSNQVLVHGPSGNYIRTLANSDLCDNIRVTAQCCVRRSYQSSGGGGGLDIDHQTANALAAVALIGVTAFLIHKHHKKVEAEKAAAAQAAVQQQPVPEQTAFQIASADQPETFVVDGVTYTKYHKAP